jgi:hypothetical protein
MAETSGQILFGTDIPAVTPDMAGWYANNVDAYFAGRPDVRKGHARQCALAAAPAGVTTAA